MGYMALSDFRTEVQSALGNRDFSDARLDRWINFGYLDLVGAIDFEELISTTPLNTQIGLTSYTIPVDDVRLIQLIQDNTNQNLLQFINKAEFYRLDLVTQGTPIKWTRVGDLISLNPTPSAIVQLTIVYARDADRLINVGDVTVLPDTWDAAVVLLATYHGLLAIGQEQRATQWFARAVNYIQSRVTQEEAFVRTPGLGLTYAVPREILLNALTEAQQASGAQGR